MYWGSNSGRTRGFSLLLSSRLALGPTFSSFQWVLGSLLEVKWLGHELSHSPASSCKVKDEWSCTPTSPLCHFCVWRHPLPLFSLHTNNGMRTGDLGRMMIGSSVPCWNEHLHYFCREAVWKEEVYAVRMYVLKPLVRKFQFVRCVLQPV